MDLGLLAATIAKAVSNFNDADEDEKRLEEDYGRVADSSVAIVICSSSSRSARSPSRPRRHCAAVPGARPHRRGAEDRSSAASG